MQRKTTLAIALCTVLSNAPASFAEVTEPDEVHSATWSLTPPVETGPADGGCSHPSCWPRWGIPESMAKLFPSKQNFELAAWCKNAEMELLKVCQEQDGWRDVPFQQCECVFLVSPDGKIQDPFVFPCGSEKADDLALAALSKVDQFPPPPIYLRNRRLRLMPMDPSKVSVYVDFNETEDPDRAAYLENMKKGYLEQLVERKKSK